MKKIDNETIKKVREILEKRVEFFDFCLKDLKGAKKRLDDYSQGKANAYKMAAFEMQCALVELDELEEPLD